MSKVAYGVYTYDTHFTASKMGIAAFDGTVVKVAGTPAELTRQDPKVFYLKDPQGNDCVLVFEVKYASEWDGEEGMISVYDTAMNVLLKPEMVSKEIDLVNLYAVVGPVTVGNEKYYYGIDHDKRKVVRFQLLAEDGEGSENKLKIVFDKEAKYEFSPTRDNGYGIDLVQAGDSLYALFVTSPGLGLGLYYSYSVVKLDLSLENAVVKEVVGGKNAYSLTQYNGDLYVVLLGGAQNFGTTNGAESKIQKIAMNGFSADSEVKTLLVGDTSFEMGDFRSLAFSASGKAYVLTGCLTESRTAFNGVLWAVSAEDLSNAAGVTIAYIAYSGVCYPFSNVEGYYWGLLYSESDHSLWVAQGNDIGVYTLGDTEIKPVSVCSIDDLSGGSVYDLNSMVLLEAKGTIKGYVSPAAAAASKAARLEREKLLGK